MLEHMVQKVEVCGRTADSSRVLTTSEYDWSANIGRIIIAQALRDTPTTTYIVSKKTMEERRLCTHNTDTVLSGMTVRQFSDNYITQLALLGIQLI